MKNNFKCPEFFLGANTPSGFFSLFDQLYYPDNGWFCHILKGGPGTGKSTLMKKVAEKSCKKKIPLEIIRCSSDPKSLDAVILTAHKKCIVDGTAPHVIDPKYPGISDEIINLGTYWDTKKLKSHETEIVKLCQENAAYHATSKKYLSAYGCAYDSTSRIISDSLNYEKLNGFCKRFAKKIIKKSTLERPSEKLRFISSVTPDGYVFLEKTLPQLCNKIYIIDDKYSIIGSFILEFLREHALDLNHEILTCPSPFAPEKHLQALFVKDLKIGIVVQNKNLFQLSMSNPGIEYKKINAQRFNQKNNFKNLINFNTKIQKEFLKEAVYNLTLARNVHDKIEALYSNAMNYTQVNKITQKLESF